MNSFGLGLVLSFTDNASAGMRRASQTFNEMNKISDQMVSASNGAVSSIETLSLAGYGLNVVGDQMTNVGSTIVSVFGSASQSIIDTGMEVMGFERQLTALYKSEELAAQKMLDIQQYARKSIFETRDLISAVTVMKAVGIEAMDAVTSSSGKTTQSLLDYAADISAMFPNMHNAYGTGVNAAMGALKEYIAEGNARSLKAGAGLNITEMLGEDKGKTIEERTRQVADLIEQLGIAGYTASLAGTPTQQLSNMQDALYMALSKIANSGVLSTYTEMLSIVANYVNDLVEDEERFNTLTKIVGEVITALLTPLKKAAEFLVKFVEGFLAFSESHPVLAKTVGILIAMSGVSLVAIGTVMKLAGGFLVLFSSIKTVSDVLRGGKGLKVVTKLLGGLKAHLFPIIAIAGLAYIVWKKNLFGIRDALTKTFKDIGTVISLVFDAFKDNTLSMEKYSLAEKLGILPLIEAILTLKYYAGILFDGFKEGFNSFLDTLSEITASWGIFNTDVFGSAKNIGEFLKNLIQPGMEDQWRTMGEVIGKFIAVALLLVPVVKSVNKVMSILGSIGSFFSKLGGSKILSLIMPKLSALAGKIGAFISKVIFPSLGKALLAGLKFLGGLIVSHPIIAAIVAVVIVIVALIVKFRKQIANFFVNLWGKIVELFNKAKETIKQVIQNIITFFMPVIEFFQAVGRLVKAIITGIVGVIKAGFNLVKTIVSNVIKVVSSIFRALYQVVRYVVLSIALFFKNAFTTIKEAIIDPVINWIAEKFQWLKDNVFTPIKEFFIGIWQEAVAFATPIIQGFITVFNTVKEAIITALTAIKDFFIQVIDAITTKVNTFFEGIKTIFNWISSKIDGIGDFLSSGINKVADWIKGKADSKEEKLVGAATGGYVKTTGIGVLHPNELVVNDRMTQQLGAFLDNQQAMQSLAPVPVSTSIKVKGGKTPDTSGHVDNSITFAAGSVVIQLSNASEAELEKAAEKLMKIIARKLQLKNMAVRA